MEIQTLKLINRETVAEGTMMFIFEKPSGFEFKPGQAMDLTLINPPETDEEGNIRTFSVLSAPFENNVAVATRMRDTAFKRVLKNLPFGTEIKYDGPYGSFTLHKNFSKPAVFIVGGIGITPFYSILKTAAKEQLPHKIFLFYSNRRPEDAAFLEHLEKLQDENPNYVFIPTMDGLEKSKHIWEGEKGVITKEMLKRYISEPLNCIFYSAGPPRMVKAMMNILSDMGIDEDNIRTEEFMGY